MEKVILIQKTYNQTNKILYKFKENDTLLNTLKNQIQGFHWDGELKSWISPYYPALKKELFQLLRGKYWLDYSGMEMKTPINKVQIQTQNPVLPPLTEEHKLHLEKFNQ